MNDQATGTTPASRMAVSSTTLRPSTFQRPRVLDRTYWRSLVRSSAVSCSARLAASDMRGKWAPARHAVGGRARQGGRVKASGRHRRHAPRRGSAFHGHKTPHAVAAAELVSEVVAPAVDGAGRCEATGMARAGAHEYEIGYVDNRDGDAAACPGAVPELAGAIGAPAIGRAAGRDAACV